MTITIIPITAIVSKASPKKILPKIEAQIICVKKKGLMILLYLPAKWYAAVQAHIEIITRIPELINNINSCLEGIRGSNIKKT